MALYIDSLDFTRNGRELRGVIRVADMPRLQDMLASADGEINYVLRGSRDQYGKSMLEVELDGRCQLRCQRCLQGLDYSVKLVSRLSLLQEGEPDEPEDSEIDSIPANTHLDVLNLLEEELLLSLPFAPMHPVGECRPAAVSNMIKAGQAEKNPFAVLAELKKKL